MLTPDEEQQIQSLKERVDTLEAEAHDHRKTILALGKGLARGLNWTAWAIVALAAFVASERLHGFWEVAGGVAVAVLWIGWLNMEMKSIFKG